MKCMGCYSEHIGSVWKLLCFGLRRRAAFEEKAPAAIVAEAVDLIHSFIEI